MAVWTVTGEVEPAELGITLPHEHLFIDLSDHRREPPEPIRRQVEALGLDLEAEPSLATLGYLRRDALWSGRNHRIDDPELLASELTLAALAGVGTIVDATGILPTRDPEANRRLSERSGVRIVAGSGYYRASAHPLGLGERSVSEIESLLMTEVTEGIDGTGIRAGVLGELGTSGTELHPVEERVLEAAARVSASTGVPMLVHTEGFLPVIRRVIAIVESVGADPAKLNVAHVSGTERSGWREIVAAGATFGMDAFGFESQGRDSIGQWWPTDQENIRALAEIAEAGHLRSVLVSHDIAHLTRLHAYGGWGYDHLVTNLVPHLRRAGFDDAALETLLVHNPARFLDRASTAR